MGEYCVTGGTGHIASFLIKSLLEKGYYVRTTVRYPDNLEKVGFLWEIKGAKERLRIMRAELMEEGSFDEAINGVDGVFHVASPVFQPSNIDIQVNVIDPCVKGTLNVLKSCKKASIKRVVLTSSCSCIRNRADATQMSPLNESHWSDTEYCKRNSLWYPYAKTIAEKEAWKFAEANEIDLVVVNPGFVLGGLVSAQPTSSMQLLLAIVKGMRVEYPNVTLAFVHIEDVVAAHILAMEKRKASGRLIVCSSSVAHWSEIIEMLRAKYPNFPYVNKCSKLEGESNPHSMDNSKILNLGLSPLKSLDQILEDSIKTLFEKGLL